MHSFVQAGDISVSTSSLVSNIVIDTSATATDTIDYVATDNAGNVATSTATTVDDEDPSNPSNTTRVLTLMLAEDY